MEILLLAALLSAIVTMSLSDKQITKIGEKLL